ncbi:hypothetical protein GLYMA_06G046100v4 [Glycine max]|uniref:Uncharacterized protein n=1 Tax=Glycine max TaxID=3847 RepID=A0A0R0JBZ1_SOYBN|nr:hypothetical protein GYH30_014079 [Glycine max]KRH52090.1 hypothetical protein GLYMA_06G046100v4 [Glycine max]
MFYYYGNDHIGSSGHVNHLQFHSIYSLSHRIEELFMKGFLCMFFFASLFDHWLLLVFKLCFLFAGPW